MDVAVAERSEAHLEAPAAQQATAQPRRARRWSARRKRITIFLGVIVVLAAGVTVALASHRHLDPFVTCLASPRAALPV